MKGPMRILDRTPEGMAERAKEMMKVGDKVKVKGYSTTREGGFVEDHNGTRIGTVIEMSRWIFVVDFGGRRESFRYSQLFHTGGGERVFLTGNKLRKEK